MNYYTAASLLRDHFATEWAARAPTVKSVPQNSRDYVNLDPDAQSWVQFSLVDNFSEIAAIGHKLRRQFSRVRVDIYTPLNKGDGRSRNYGDIIADIWDTAEIPGILIEAPEFVPGGPHEELPWWTDSVSTPVVFMHDPSEV